VSTSPKKKASESPPHSGELKIQCHPSRAHLNAKDAQSRQSPGYDVSYFMKDRANKNQELKQNDIHYRRTEREGRNEDGQKKADNQNRGIKPEKNLLRNLIRDRDAGRAVIPFPGTE